MSYYGPAASLQPQCQGPPQHVPPSSAPPGQSAQSAAPPAAGPAPLHQPLPHAFPQHPMPQMTPSYGGLYPAVAASLDRMTPAQHMAAFTQQHHRQQQLAAAAAVAAPIASAPLPVPISGQTFPEEAVIAAQNLAAQRSIQTMQSMQNMQNIQNMQNMQNMAAHGLVTPAMIPASSTLTSENVVSEEDLDVGSIPLPELLNKINPGLMADMQVEAPGVLELLLQQKTNQQLEGALPLPTAQQSRRDLVAAAAAAAAATPIDPDAITSQLAGATPSISTATAMMPGIQPAPPEYGYLTGMVSSMPIAAPNVTQGAVGANGGPTRDVGGRRPNGGQAPTAASSAASAVGTAPVGSPSPSSKASRPRVGQKRAKADTRVVGTVKQEMTPMGALYDARSPTPGGEADMGDVSENNEVRKAMRAERNRQSAAASRERKKNHIKELERRVTALSQQNAKLQVEQLDAIRFRIGKEQKLTEENKSLKRVVVNKDMKIHELTHKLEKAGIEPPKKIPEIQELNLKRPSTWGSSSWQESQWGSGRQGT